MKKKIISMCLVICLLAVAVVGGTLAYFTDTDAETNTFTVGNVSIDLKETYTQDSQLMPGIDVNKDAWIVNDGKNAAWVWAEVLIPDVLDDEANNSPDAPGKDNSLHYNFPGKFSVEYAQNTNADGKFYNADKSQLWIHQHNADGVEYGYAGQVNVDNVKYNKYVILYKDQLAAGASTSNFLDKVYMDSKVAQCTTEGHENCLVLMDGKTHYDGTWEIIVRAYGIQAEGFDNVVSAWKAYDGANPAEKENGMA